MDPAGSRHPYFLTFFLKQIQPTQRTVIFFSFHSKEGIASCLWHITVSKAPANSASSAISNRPEEVSQRTSECQLVNTTGSFFPRELTMTLERDKKQQWYHHPWLLHLNSSWWLYSWGFFWWVLLVSIIKSKRFLRTGDKRGGKKNPWRPTKA